MVVLWCAGKGASYTPSFNPLSALLFQQKDHMLKIAIASGKGGTGKTSIVAAFAVLAERKILVDCDVDAADLHLVLNPRIDRREDFSGGKKALIAEDLCTGCGRCLEVCRFNAVSCVAGPDAQNQFVVDPISCGGYGLCACLYPAEAIRFEPVIASITGADLVVAVTEPTCSGLHDVQRVVDLTSHFRIPVILCINKWDIHPEMADRIERETTQRGVKMVGRIRYDPAMTKAQIMKTTIVEYTGGAISTDIQTLWRNVVYALG